MEPLCRRLSVAKSAPLPRCQPGQAQQAAPCCHSQPPSQPSPAPASVVPSTTTRWANRPPQRPPEPLMRPPRPVKQAAGRRLPATRGRTAAVAHRCRLRHPPQKAAGQTQLPLTVVILPHNPGAVRPPPAGRKFHTAGVGAPLSAREPKLIPPTLPRSVVRPEHCAHCATEYSATELFSK